VHRGSFTLGPVDAQVDWADRVVITGANGSGKSTLLARCSGRIPLDGGSGGLGSGVRVGEIDQAAGCSSARSRWSGRSARRCPDWPESEVRTLLAKFGLTGEHVPRPAASLSPGERTRAALALLQAREVNLLVLDEPTNHLDLPAIEQLEQALDAFPGTVLLVTHDRRMLDTVRSTRRWTVADGKLSEDRGDPAAGGRRGARRRPGAAGQAVLARSDYAVLPGRRDRGRETPEEAAVRELAEETTLTAGIDRLLWTGATTSARPVLPDARGARRAGCSPARRRWPTAPTTASSWCGPAPAVRRARPAPALPAPPAHRLLDDR
jgi:ABC-type lipoprotein export system ATPase subunit